MKTINDVLNFFNRMEIYNIISGIQIDNFVVIRKILLKEFNSVYLDRLVELLRNFDDLYIDYLKMTIDFDKSRILTLRNLIFDMYDKKMSRISEDVIT